VTLSEAPARLAWAPARIVAREPVTDRVTLFRFAVDWPAPQRAGQYVELKLTAADGYTAQRFYSIASPPAQRGTVDLLIERAADGEVSRFFHEVAEAGDEIELRGPAGLPFSWAPEDGGPLLLVGGGSGVVPLLAMARERAARAPEIPAALVLAARTRGEALCLAELEARARSDAGFALHLALSRDPGGRRLDAALLAAALASLPEPPRRVFICGSGGFVETASALAVEAGLAPGTIRTERFG
jgi:ferredoxin-NADP reductase